MHKAAACQKPNSRPEFIAKLGVAVEESDEAVGWLEFMRDGGLGSDKVLLSEATQLSKIFTTCLINARRNMGGRGKP